MGLEVIAGGYDPQSPTLCEECAAEFPRLSEVFDEREAVGLDRYGAPLDPLADDRDFSAEAIEEMADAMVYVSAEMRRLVPLKRTDHNAHHRWLVLSQARRALARCMLDLADEAP